MPTSFRNTFVLLFVVLLLGAAFFFLKEGGRSNSSSEQASESAMTQQEIEEITELRIQKHDETLTLLKEDETWRIDGNLVDQQLMSQLMATLELLPVGELVSRNEENWMKYGVHEINGRSIVLLEGDEISHRLILGTQTPSGQMYIRRGDDAQVYQIRSDLYTFFSRNPDQWRALSIARFDVDDVTRFEVRVSSKKWTFERTDQTWAHIVEEGSVALSSSDDVQQYLTSLTGVRANSVTDEEGLFSEPNAAIALDLSDGTQYVMTVDSAEDGSRSAVQISAETGTFEISSDLAQSLRPQFVFADDTASAE